MLLTCFSCCRCPATAPEQMRHTGCVCVCCRQRLFHPIAAQRTRASGCSFLHFVSPRRLARLNRISAGKCSDRLNRLIGRYIDTQPPFVLRQFRAGRCTFAPKQCNDHGRRRWQQYFLNDCCNVEKIIAIEKKR